MMRYTLALLALLTFTGCWETQKKPVGAVIPMIEYYDPGSITGVNYIIPTADGTAASPDNRAIINLQINVPAQPAPAAPAPAPAPPPAQ